MSSFVLLDTADVEPEIFIEVDGYAITVDLAEDDETGLCVFVDCVLNKREGVLYEGRPPMEFWEFAFQIVLTDNWRGGDATETMDRFVARDWLPPGGNSAALAIAERCLGLFIEKFDPEILYRVTNSSGLPEKALLKHRRLTMAAQRYGYVVDHEGLDEEGRCFWVMK